MSLCVQEACWPLCCSSSRSLSSRLSLGSPLKCSLRSGYTNTSAHLLTWEWYYKYQYLHFLVPSDYSIISVLFLWHMYLYHCFAAFFCPPHLPPPSSLPLPLSSWLAASTTPKRPNSRSHRALLLQDWWSTSKHSTPLQSVWAWLALPSPHKHAVL